MLKISGLKDKAHFIGIGGVSMSALANILLCNGVKVSGSDDTDNGRLQKLRKSGAVINIGLSAKNITHDMEYVVYTAAVKPTNPELKAAIELGIPVIERKVFLGELVQNYANAYAVAGTHGKTSTTAMLSIVLMELGLDPTVLVGGELDKINGNYLVGNSDNLVFEACEYVDSFLCFYPKASIILNIDSDHLDYFDGIEQIKKSFINFTKNTSDDGFVVLNLADEHSRAIVGSVDKKKVTFSINPEFAADYNARKITYDEGGLPSFDVLHNGEILCRISLNVLGEHNVSNALSVFALVHTLGQEAQKIADALRQFKGINQRFTYHGEKNGVKYYNDYAHHPTEIIATINAVRKMPHNKIWVVFQPHTYTRTLALRPQFVKALEMCDRLVLTDIYAAREVNEQNVRSSLLFSGRIGDAYIKDLSNAAKYVDKFVEQGDIVIAMGAGDVAKVIDYILS